MIGSSILPQIPKELPPKLHNRGQINTIKLLSYNMQLCPRIEGNENLSNKSYLKHQVR